MVTWRDAHFDFDQRSAEPERDDYLVHTLGFLIFEGGRFVSIAQEVLPDDDGFRAVSHIPRAVVERVDYLDVDVR